MNPYNIPLSIIDNGYDNYQNYNINNTIYHEHRNNTTFKERWINDNITCINLFITKRST